MALPVGIAQNFVSERRTVPANGTLRFSYDFKPDQIFFFSPDRSMSNGIYIHLMGMQGAGTIPILAQGPVITPGVSENQEIILTSQEAVAVDLLIVAQRGYPPITVTAPTTLIRPDSVAIQSQLIHEVQSLLQVNTINHNHIGRYILVFWGMHVSEFDTERFTSVTAGGSTGIELFNVREADTTPNRYFTELGAYWIDVAGGDGNLTINCNLSGTPGTKIAHYMQVYSFMDGLRTGNDDTDKKVGSGTMALSVLGDNENSRTFAVALSLDSGAAPYINELSGADVWDPLHKVANYASRWVMSNVREGKGTHTYQYQVSTGTFPAVCAAVEITTT